MSIGKYVIAAVGLLLIFPVGKYLRRRAKRKQLLVAPFPAEWEKIVRKNVPLSERLPESLKKQLRGLVHVFLAEKD
ncbi:MAG: zinc-dependent peptidase, partial [Planctomycetota bacterium]|nr:zinc-dependent peptidase [Planctomycetota bacterium]